MKEFELSARLGNPYCDVLAVLNQCNCPYLVIGGVAVVLHGSSRFTPDINILVDFESENINNIFSALAWLGLKSETKVNLDELKDEAVRKQLLEANQPLFKISSPEYPGFSADLLITEIDDFQGMYNRRVELNAFDQVLPIISLLDLIAMKVALNRPQDQMDVTQLGIVQAIQSCKEAGQAIASLSKSLPADFDQAMLENMAAFQELNPNQKMQWLLEMLAAIGGFCLVR